TLASERQLEMQIWLGGGCVLFIIIFALMGLTTLTGESVYRRAEPLVVLIFYAGLAYAITSHRVFDARQILFVGLEKIFLVVIVTAAAVFLEQLFAVLLSEYLALLATTLVALWFAG